MKKSICFDLDNTLYDHGQYVKGAYKDIAVEIERKYGIAWEEFYSKIYTRWEKLTSRYNRVFSDVLKEYDLYSAKIEKSLVDIYRNHIPSLMLYSGVKEKLQSLLCDGFQLVLLTDGQPSVQKRKIISLGIPMLVFPCKYFFMLGLRLIPVKIFSST